ncbi:MAG: DUF5943 domain-containing protein [Paraburkholderia sp.]|uniref:DUF5943 domain-containing protein n=1 Tax=Paraburkholderia sp. TaxID=1926495 RepID=UPI00397DB210
MTKLPVPVDIDNESGAWMSEGQPMILIPRRFWVFVQKQAEEQFGLVATAELLNHATRNGTSVWCEQEELRSGACREEVLKRYFDRVSARGMGRFAIKSIDVDTGHLAVELHNSIYVAEYGNVGRCVCYPFASAVAGAVEYLAGGSTLSGAQISGQEVCCEANGHSHCLFEAGPGKNLEHSIG